MKEILSLLNLIIVLFLGVSGIFLVYKNRKKFNIITGSSIKYSIKIVVLLFILILFLYSLLMIININFKLLNFIIKINTKHIFASIPENLSIAILEEFLFRVFILVIVLKYINNKNIAIFIVSVMFSLYHFPSNGILFVSYLIGGVVYGYSFLKFQTILVPIGIHFSWNFVQGAIFGFSVSGQESVGIFNLEIVPNQFFNGGSYGPEASILGIIMRLVILFVIFLIPAPQDNKDFLDLSETIAHDPLKK